MGQSQMFDYSVIDLNQSLDKMATSFILENFRQISPGHHPTRLLVVHEY